MDNQDRRRSIAAKELRRRLGLSQSAFGHRIGRTLNTVLRYESQIEPRAEALLPYAALAIRAGHADLAEFFRAALLEDFGADLELVVSWQPNQNGSEVHIPHDMVLLVDAFLNFMLAKNTQPAEELARNSLKQLLLNEYSGLSLPARKHSG